MSATWTEKLHILGFSVPIHFSGHLEEIDIVKVLLETKPHRERKFQGCRFSDI